MDKQEIINALTWRTAIKTFDETRKISDEDFAFLLESARLSPSSFGFEPWNIVVLQNPNLRDAIKPFGQYLARQLDSASHLVAFTVKTDLTPGSQYFDHIITDIMHDDDLDGWHESFRNFAEKDMQMRTDRERHDWACKQAYIAMANMISSAALIGVDSCPIEGFDYGKVNELLAEKDVISPEMDRLAVMCAFGYRSGNPDHAKTRRDLGEIVKFVG